MKPKGDQVFGSKKNTPMKGKIKSKVKEWTENKHFGLLSVWLSWCEKRHKGAKTPIERTQKIIIYRGLEIKCPFLLDIAFNGFGL